MSLHEPEKPVSLDHLRRLTDCFGILQHADYALPDYRSGYTTDDNARALMAVSRHYRLHGDALSQQLAHTYLAFVRFTQRADGHFHNFVGYDRRPTDEVGSEDCFGRALCSLAYVLFSPPMQDLVGPAERMFHQALPWLARLEHPRGKASCITALYWWWQAQAQHRERAESLLRRLADDLVACYQEHSTPTWRWLLAEMTYANAKLPEALFRAYQVSGEEIYRTVAVRSMEFLCEKTFRADKLCLVGNKGWYRANDAEPPGYDQQPIDAAAMVEAALAGFEATAEPEYLRRAWLSLCWFFGHNSQDLSLYDAETGGCFDGLTENGVNRNRGAESTISLLLAQLSVLEARQKISEKILSEGRAVVPA